MPNISRRSFIKGAITMSAMPLFASTDNKKSPSQTLKFIHITDSHMDIGDSSSIEAMELMVTFINENYKELDFVLFGGDNFNNNAKANSDALLFKKIIDKLHAPTLLVRGNKESSPKPINDAIGEKEFQKLFIENRVTKHSNNDWLLEIKGFNVLGLDSCINDANNGRYTEETLAFAEKTLQNKKPTLILNHHPYTNYWGATDKKEIHKYVLNNTQEVQKRLFHYDNLLLTLSGHKHIDSVKTIQNTKTIVTRGFVRPLDLDMYPMRYVEIKDTLINEKLIYTS